MLSAEFAGVIWVAGDHYIPCYLKIWMGIQPWGQRYG